MQAITQAQLAEMKDWFLPDRPGPLIGLHIIHTGYGTAHVEALCEDIFNRGRKPSWTTSPDNIASLRVARKLTFIVQRQDYLYVVNMQIPSVA
jgi:hypothetical protein